MTATIPPITVPGDKSIAHRALLVAALAHGPRGCATSRPVSTYARRSARYARSASTIAADGDALVVTGSGGELSAPDGPIDCGNSGTTIRLLAGVLATRRVDGNARR